MRRVWFLFIVAGFALPVLAEDGQGWNFSGRLQGNSSSSGFVTKVDPTAGYGFGRHFQTYFGLPVYFVKPASTTTQTTTSFTKGIGNAYVGFRADVETESLDFASTVEGTAPTGNKENGFSTGRATVDWTNSVSHNFSIATAFGSAGLANTVSDTSFFVRPFTSLGLVSHFDGGAKFHLSPVADLGAAAYAVRAGGQQRIVSKVVRDQPKTSAASSARGNADKRVFETTQEVVGSAELANDEGFSTWLAAHTASRVDFHFGYSRSIGYGLNTVFFGVGFRLGN
jgi:hypothetical protein